MYSWEEDPYTDELYEWECKMQEEYNKYIEEVCNCFEDCECMSLGKFMDKALEDIADRYDDFIEEYPEGAYA